MYCTIQNAAAVKRLHTTTVIKMESVNKESAETYSQTSSPQREAGRKLISKLSIPKGAKILDLGCGTGETTTDLSEVVGPEGTIVAVDPDADRIKLAKEKNARANIKFVVGSDQTFPEDPYDVVFMNCVINWVVDKEALYKRVYDNLRPGGSFVFTTTNGDFEIPAFTKNLFDAVLPRFFEDIYLKKAQYVKFKVYEELRKSTAFVQHSTEIETRYVYCANADACLEWHFGLLQGDFDLSSVDQEALQAFKKDHDAEVNMPFDILFEVLKKLP